MARIRTIKPEFWTSSQVTDCSHSARLLFIGMWNFADDAGVIPYKPRDIRARVFPADDDVTSEVVRRLIGELVKADLLYPYEGDDGEKYLVVTGWKHQKIEKPTYKYPKPPSAKERKTGQMALAFLDESPTDRRPIADPTPPGREGKGVEGKEGKGGEPPTIRRTDDAEGEQPMWRQIIVAFDDARAAAYGEAQRRPYPHTDDRQHALRFIEAGADLELCKSVFEAICERQRSKGKRAPWSLEFFENPIAEALKARTRPMPAETKPNGNGAHAPTSQPTKEEVREQMQNRAQVIKRGTYLSAVTIQDVQAMIRLGWLTADDATKAGYAL
jgi:hypothetical protein